jgi:hypothetical protein
VRERGDEVLEWTMKDYKVWYAIPSCNQVRCSESFAKWKEMGYLTCVLLDKGADQPKDADLIMYTDVYEGYYKSFITMARTIGRDADMIVTGGDDIFPDPSKKASEIAHECMTRYPDGLFVMQPTGDAMSGVESICASPWFGRGWLDRGYQGRFPVWHEYIAFFGDQELKEVAERIKCLWQRKDLCQYHHHWSRVGGPAKTDYQIRNDRYWKHDEAIYKKRMMQKFPQMWPLPPNSPKLLEKLGIKQG